MFCKYCGENISEDSVFCSKCGKVLAATSFKEDAASVKSIHTEYEVCSICGNTLLPGERPDICDMCYYDGKGATIGEVVKKVVYKPLNKRKHFLIWFLAVFLIAVLCLGVKIHDLNSASNAIALQSSSNPSKYDIETAFLSDISELVSTITGKMKFDYGSFAFVDSQDGTYIVWIDFTSKNAFNVDLKYTAKGMYKFDKANDELTLTLLAVDDEVYYSTNDPQSSNSNTP